MNLKKTGLVCTLLVFPLLFAATVKADDMAFTGENNADFGTLDLNTGAFTLLGNSGQTLAGMAVANGELFASSYHLSTGTLFQVNPANGGLTTIGSSAVDIDDFGSTTSGLYVIGLDKNLYLVNPMTGAETLVGPTGISSFGSWRSLSTNSSTLYFANGTSLYSINTTTGAATLIGSLGTAEIGAMVFEDGTLWGGANIPGEAIDTINVSTGAATTGPTPSSAFDNTFFALAPSPLPTSGSTGVPEPSSLLMLASGLLALMPIKNKLLRKA
jgi:hypothetical protein